MLAFATEIMDAVTLPIIMFSPLTRAETPPFLAGGALDIGGGIVELQHVGLSLGAFIAGSLICDQLGNCTGRIRRVWLLTTNILQTALVFVAAALHNHTGHVNDEPMNLGIIALLTFASGAKVRTFRGHLPLIWCFLKLQDMFGIQAIPCSPIPSQHYSSIIK